ncbi:unnamed protein product, partial [Ectocarpus sp. 13 AM-2016]
MVSRETTAPPQAAPLAASTMEEVEPASPPSKLISGNRRMQTESAPAGTAATETAAAVDVAVHDHDASREERAPANKIRDGSTTSNGPAPPLPARHEGVGGPPPTGTTCSSSSSSNQVPSTCCMAPVATVLSSAQATNNQAAEPVTTPPLLLGSARSGPSPPPPSTPSTSSNGAPRRSLAHGDCPTAPGAAAAAAAAAAVTAADGAAAAAAPPFPSPPSLSLSPADNVESPPPSAPWLVERALSIKAAIEEAVNSGDGGGGAASGGGGGAGGAGVLLPAAHEAIAGGIEQGAGGRGGSGEVFPHGVLAKVPRLVADLHDALGRAVSTNEARAWVRALDRLGEGLDRDQLLEACLDVSRDVLRLDGSPSPSRPVRGESPADAAAPLSGLASTALAEESELGKGAAEAAGAAITVTDALPRGGSCPESVSPTPASCSAVVEAPAGTATAARTLDANGAVLPAPAAKTPVMWPASSQITGPGEGDGPVTVALAQAEAPAVASDGGARRTGEEAAAEESVVSGAVSFLGNHPHGSSSTSAVVPFSSISTAQAPPPPPGPPPPPEACEPSVSQERAVPFLAVTPSKAVLAAAAAKARAAARASASETTTIATAAPPRLAPAPTAATVPAPAPTPAVGGENNSGGDSNAKREPSWPASSCRGGVSADGEVSGPAPATAEAADAAAGHCKEGAGAEAEERCPAAARNAAGEAPAVPRGDAGGAPEVVTSPTDTCDCVGIAAADVAIDCDVPPDPGQSIGSSGSVSVGGGGGSETACARGVVGRGTAGRGRKQGVRRNASKFPDDVIAKV